jgi:chromosome segregation ATPase
MRTIAIAAILCGTTTGLCQTPPNDPDTLRALLAEVHQLRQNIEGAVIASQRVQIALYSLQMQGTVVARAEQRLDDARNKCSVASADQAHMTADVERLESVLNAGTLAAAETKDLQSHLTEIKVRIEAQAVQVQTCQAAEAEASSQLRNAQAKLVDLQNRIELLDKTLEKLGASEK